MHNPQCPWFRTPIESETWFSGPRPPPGVGSPPQCASGPAVARQSVGKNGRLSLTPTDLGVVRGHPHVRTRKVLELFFWPTMHQRLFASFPKTLGYTRFSRASPAPKDLRSDSHPSLPGSDPVGYLVGICLCLDRATRPRPTKAPNQPRSEPRSGQEAFLGETLLLAIRPKLSGTTGRYTG